jgi:phosphoenolpyruvate carboxykinase (GTP)
MNSTTQPDHVAPAPADAAPAPPAAATREHASPGALASRHVRHFVHEALKLCLPDEIYWFNGSAYERRKLIEGAVADGGLVAVDPVRLPGCYVRGHGRDAAEDADDGGPCGERATLVCTVERGAAAPADNWMGSPAGRARVRELFDRCMVRRTMYVVPFVAGPFGPAPARAGVLVTDSLFAALRTAAMTRAGDAALAHLGERDDFARCLHSVGGRSRERFVFRFPDEHATYSFGSAHPLGRDELFLTAPAPPR